MATHDYALANQSGSSFRTDLNNVLAAIVSNNSASSEPSTKYAYQYWADTSGGYLKIRNAANNAWIQLFKLDGTLSDIPVEGTVVKSTGESGGTKFLREDGDNSCSWQSISQTALTGSTNNTITTVTGANAIQGEANLTFDGSTLDITGAVTSSGTITANGYLSVSDQIMHTGDVDTTVRFPAADTVAIETGGSERLRVDSGGRLLIGTTTNSGTSSSGDDIIIGSIGDSTSRGITFATTADATIRWADAGDNSMGRIQYLNNTDIMSFHTANAERLRIDSDGLKFNGDTAAANALSDYEEGTWTPAIGFAGNANNVTYGSSQGGSYTKIGRFVYVHGRIHITDKGDSTGAATIRNLPFTAGNHTSGSSSIEGGAFFTYQSNWMSNLDKYSVLAYIPVGTTNVELFYRNDSGDLVNITDSSWENTTSLAFEAFYPV